MYTLSHCLLSSDTCILVKAQIFRLLQKKCITQKIEENPDKDFLVATTAGSFQGKWCDKNRTKMEKTCQAY